METKQYGWGGWKMPFTNLNDPEYCEYGCPICRQARQGQRLAKILQNLELWLTFGGCPWGRARKRKYGVNPDQSLPDRFHDNVG